jgi:hypothetical protein
MKTDISGYGIAVDLRNSRLILIFPDAKSIWTAEQSDDPLGGLVSYCQGPEEGCAAERGKDDILI